MEKIGTLFGIDLYLDDNIPPGTMGVIDANHRRWCLEQAKRFLTTKLGEGIRLYGLDGKET